MPFPAELDNKNMFRLLAVSPYYPRPDRASGDLRFYTLLGLLARKYDICFCALDSHGSILPGNSYSAKLGKLGITIGQVDLPTMLKSHQPDIVWFEFYHQARPDYIKLVRRECPNARVLIDSVDVHFNRLAAKAKLSGLPEDHDTAVRIQEEELAAYSQAELVVAVTENDAHLLRDALPHKAVSVVPNAHTIHPFPAPSQRNIGELVFVGGFAHPPNVDAMLYFCRDVFPLISSAYPEVRLKIIGSNAPDSIMALADDRIEVLGYVPDIAPLLERAYISVAPLRYGGGMKGKVGEALSFGLPVVTTTFGAEGFGLEVGRDVLVGDTPESFAAHVIALLKDRQMHADLARNGYRFIEQHYSVAAVETMLDRCMNRLIDIPPQPRPWPGRLRDAITSAYERHIGWRIHRR